MNALLKFGVTGGIGFCVDALILYLLVRVGGMSPFGARIPSFLVAVGVTWWINRSFTFPTARRATMSRRDEYLRYVGVQVAGAMINYGVFAGALLLKPEWRSSPVIPLALGSVFALTFNYGGARYLVFPAQHGRTIEEG